MNRTIFSLLVLLLFGLFSQPITAQSSKNQQTAENKVARMSEAEMRTELQAAKARQKDLQNVLRTGNYTEFYGMGDDVVSQGVAKAGALSEYDYVTAIINAIEKRLVEIEEKRKQEEKKKKDQEELEKKKKEQEELEKKKKEQEELERQKKEQEELERQRQEELERQRQEELERQRQEEFQKSFERNLEESQERYNKHHTDVDNNANATSEENRALERATGEIDPNSKPVTANMMDEPLFPTSTPKLGDISSKFNKPKETKEEPKETKEELEEESQNNQDLDAEIRKLLQELENGISNFPKEEL